ncbi:MAG: hypothetical protein AAB838_03615 [Patescibacteria group bacterium]
MDICPNCQNLVPEGSVSAAPLSTTLFKQLTIYAISFFLPPFGLWWGIKYLKQTGDIYKKIGWLSIVLTIFSIIVNLYLIMSVIGSLSSQVSDLNLNSLNY